MSYDSPSSVMGGLGAKPKPPKKVPDKRKHGIARTIVDHNHDGSHSMEFQHIDPRRESSKQSAPDLESLKDHLQEMLGGKPKPEEM